MNLYETPEETLRRFLTLLEELDNSPLGPVMEKEVAAPMRHAFCSLLPDDGQDVDSVTGAFQEYQSSHTTPQ